MQKNPAAARFREIIQWFLIIVGIVAPLVTLGIRVNDVISKPVLTYDCRRHCLPTEESLISIMVRNEGRTSAEEVEINITLSGEIENVAVLKQLMSGQTTEFELFGESVSIAVEKSSAIIRIPYIAPGFKYMVDLISESKDRAAIHSRYVTSKNGGIAQEYVEKRPLASGSFGVGFIAGAVFAVGVVFLYRKLKEHQHKGARARSPKHEVQA